MPAIILADAGWTGSFETSSFHGLSGGKTCKAARILSASGVLNMTGLVISGIFGRSAPTAASTAHSATVETLVTAGVLTTVAGKGDHGERIHTTRGGRP